MFRMDTCIKCGKEFKTTSDDYTHTCGKCDTDTKLKGFTIKCNKCGAETIITEDLNYNNDNIYFYTYADDKKGIGCNHCDNIVNGY